MISVLISTRTGWLKVSRHWVAISVPSFSGWSMPSTS